MILDVCLEIVKVSFCRKRVPGAEDYVKQRPQTSKNRPTGHCFSYFWGSMYAASAHQGTHAEPTLQIVKTQVELKIILHQPMRLPNAGTFCNSGGLEPLGVESHSYSLLRIVH